MADLETQIQKLSVANAGLESQRKSLGNAVVDPAIAALREQLKQLESARGDRAETDERKLVTIVFADVSVQSRCLTYRAVAFRRLGDVVRCTTEATRTLELATKLGMIEYIAMAKASLAWIAWRQEDHPEAKKLASKELELWHGMDDPYGSIGWRFSR